MRIACCQLDIRWEDKAANYAAVRRLVKEAALPDGSLVVLPEMFATGFSMNSGLIREPSGGATESFLVEMTREYGVFCVAGLAAADGTGHTRNQCIVVSPQTGVVARYNKIQLFTLGTEAEHYEPGEEVTVIDWHGCAMAPLVCYDLRFPELFRRAVDLGAQLFTVIANWPAKRQHHWTTLLQARAIENQAYVVGVNRCGTDPNHIYPGRSMIIDPLGTVLAEIGDREGVVAAEVDVGLLCKWRQDFPALRDRHRG